MARNFKEGETCAGGCGKNTGVIQGRGMCPSCYQKVRRAEAQEQEAHIEEILSGAENDSAADIIELRPGSLTDLSVSSVSLEDAVEGDSGIKGAFKKMFGASASKDQNAGFKNTPFITKESKPKPPQKRVSAADSLGDLWSAVGGIIGRSPAHRASGQLLIWQSMAAGEIMDDAVKGTKIDSMLIQRAVRARGKFDQVGSIIIPPLLVFAIEMNPDRAPALIPMLETSLRSSLPYMVPAIKKARKRQEDQMEAVKELFPDAPEGTDPIQGLIQELFAGFAAQQAPENPYEYQEPERENSWQ